MPSKKIEGKRACHDCKKVFGPGQKMHTYAVRDGEIYKCDECFKKAAELKNFQNCEVYSRVVGYLRPVQQWNKGKQAEFNNRKTFSMPA